MEMEADCQTMTVPEAARALGLARNTAYALAARGELPGVLRLGRRWVVSRVALQRALIEAGQDREPTPTT